MRGFTYAREVGSTNTELVQALQGFTGSFILTVDENHEVEHYMDAADSQSWIFAYIEEYVRHRPRTTITES